MSFRRLSRPGGGGSARPRLFFARSRRRGVCVARPALGWRVSRPAGRRRRAAACLCPASWCLWVCVVAVWRAAGWCVVGCWVSLGLGSWGRVGVLWGRGGSACGRCPFLVSGSWYQAWFVLATGASGFEFCWAGRGLPGCGLFGGRSGCGPTGWCPGGCPGGVWAAASVSRRCRWVGSCAGGAVCLGYSLGYKGSRWFRV